MIDTILPHENKRIEVILLREDKMIDTILPRGNKMGSRLSAHSPASDNLTP
jgi:hypothetical protein